jgi:hypothetical protein
MAKKNNSNDIDKILKDLYALSSEFNDKLSVVREMVKLEMARLRGDQDLRNPIPEGLQDEKEK